jgi:aspartyl-tRNA(Asn)/glutamyl-tRNA(Gln) amidotransferase subunit B
VIEKNPKQVAEFRSGKDAVVMFLVGQVMKLSKGRAKPDAVQKLLRGKLKS